MGKDLLAIGDDNGQIIISDISWKGGPSEVGLLK